MVPFGRSLSCKSVFRKDQPLSEVVVVVVCVCGGNADLDALHCALCESEPKSSQATSPYLAPGKEIKTHVGGKNGQMQPQGAAKWWLSKRQVPKKLQSQAPRLPSNPSASRSPDCGNPWCLTLQQHHLTRFIDGEIKWDLWLEEPTTLARG